jgi:ribosomal protein S20
MPIIKSAKKRVRTARKATVLNVGVKRALKAAQKDLRQAIAKGSKTALADHQKKVQSALDKAVKKNIMSKHKAARKKRQLVAQVRAAGGTNPAKVVKAPLKKTLPKQKPATKVTASKKTKPAAKTTRPKKT